MRNWPQDRAGVAFQFKCTQCGKCCTGKGGRVRVNEREIEEIAAALGAASVADVKRRFLRPVPAAPETAAETHAQWALRQTPDDSQCVFLDGAKCSIYQARPTQCRTFPWWPQHLVSDYDWQLAAQDCEGITLSPAPAALLGAASATGTAEVASAPTGVSTDTPTVFPFGAILPHAIVHDIHRSGENFTHDELQAMLADLLAADPGVVRDYKRDLVRSVARRVVHCDADVTVLDTMAHGEAPTRCFVFNDRLHLVQSEVTLLPAVNATRSSDSHGHVVDNEAAATTSDAASVTTEVVVDRRALALDVHRAMCVAFALQASASRATATGGADAGDTDDAVTSPRELRVAVLGSGAATLPLFLLEHVDIITQLDAVEPSAAVNRVARRFFGLAAAERRDARLRVHECTGEAFVAKQLAVGGAAHYDVLLLDVEAGDVANEDTSRELRDVRAPPPVMLAHAFLADARALLAPAGVLVVNVIAADDAALARAEAALARGFVGTGQDASDASDTSEDTGAGLVAQLEKNTVVYLFGDDAHPLASAVGASLLPPTPLSASHDGVSDCATAASRPSEDDAVLRSRVAALLSRDAFQSQRVRSPALLQQHVRSVRRLRAVEPSAVDR